MLQASGVIIPTQTVSPGFASLGAWDSLRYFDHQLRPVVVWLSLPKVGLTALVASAKEKKNPDRLETQADTAHHEKIVQPTKRRGC